MSIFQSYLYSWRLYRDRNYYDDCSKITQTMYIYVYIFIFIASNAQVKQCHVINLVMINYINFYTIIFCAFDRTKCKKYWNVLTITIKHNIFLCNWVLLYHGSPQHNFNEISNASHSITQIIQSICFIFLQSDPDFVARISNYTKFQSHHLTVNQFQPEFFRILTSKTIVPILASLYPGHILLPANP